MNCVNCNNETKNPKFCSRSCSASFTNRSKPKRKATEKFCLRCEKSLGFIPYTVSGSGICDDCKITKPRNVDWDLETKASLRGMGNSNYGGRFPYIRVLSRKNYINSGKDMKCKICEYDLHVDVCHIKDVQDFPDDALIREINHIDNLVALCKNHHWEFDNGYLSL